MRTGLKAIVALTLLASGCSGYDRPGAGGPPPVDSIRFSLNSWGREVGRWQIRADGSGEWAQEDRDAPRDAALIVTPIPADATHMAEIRAILARAEAIAPDGLKCRKEIYDLPYGFIEWNRADGTRRINFDLGCTSKQADAVFGALKAADDKVGGWAAAAKKGKTP